MNYTRRVFSAITLLIILSTSISLSAQYSLYEQFDPSEVTFASKDFGTMWTFDDIPYKYLEETYSFTPSKEWLEHVRKSALQFGGGCSAAFVSADGLIMTNHHCGRDMLHTIQQEGENLLRDGFYAETMEKERKIKGIYVDQLISIDDVTEIIRNEMTKGDSDDEKVQLKNEKIKEIIEQKGEETGLVCNVVTLYNGGKYSLYCYKRYDDLRLVMAPDFQIAATGWDWDNFTYPRYELDFMFFRAYDVDGNPVVSKDYFPWSKAGAEPGEPIFVIGRPGNTNRLMTVADYDFFRKILYPTLLLNYNEKYKAYFELFESRPEEESKLLNSVMGLGNGRKAFAGRLKGLEDKYLTAKKQQFETHFKGNVFANQPLKNRYGHIWRAIKSAREEQANLFPKYYILMPYQISDIIYFKRVTKILEYARQMKLPVEKRSEAFKEMTLDRFVASIYKADEDIEKADKLLRAHANSLIGILGKNDPLAKLLYNGLKGNDAVEYVKENSLLTSEAGIRILLKMKPEEIPESTDPFISYAEKSHKEFNEVNEKYNEVSNTLEILHQELGEAMFEVYGNKLAPDATSTLRISDGTIAPYEYNGTLAPPITTYYGLWDRYYSFGKKTYPWGLHERWKTPPAGLDLRTPVCFASTNDIVGGNSGSSLINRKGEIVGLAHDGNLESLAGHFAFLPEKNRCIATDSRGLIEALKHIWNAKRLVHELTTGKSLAEDK